MTGRELYDRLPDSAKAANRHLLDPKAGPEAALDKAKAEGPVLDVTKTARARKGPNKNELRYKDQWLRHIDARYEAVSFLMENGHRFTPDWARFGLDGRLSECVEVKGNYKLHSQRSARLAFDQCRREFWGIRWIWAKWNGKTYDIEAYPPEKNRVVRPEEVDRQG